MPRTNRVISVLLSLAVMPAMVSGCGSGADVDEFCEAFRGVGEAAGSSAPGDEPADVVRAIKRAVEDLREIGPPDSMEPKAQSGFKLSTQALLDLPADAGPEDLAEAARSLSGENSDVRAYNTYVANACPVNQDGE